MSNQKNETKTFSNTHIAPEYRKPDFHCPHCDVYSHQNWSDICRYNRDFFIKEARYFLHRKGTAYLESFLNEIYTNSYISDSSFAFCEHCQKYSIWINEKMIYPHSSTAPLPIDEMPENVKELFNEARAVLNQSPRGACALLRLAIQYIVKELGEDEKNLNKEIDSLVEKGLPEKMQQALDTIRVIGNNAIHPGKIDVKDNLEIAHSLFKLLNFISEKMIKDNKEIENIFSSLPKDAKETIKKRDSKDAK